MLGIDDTAIFEIRNIQKNRAQFGSQRGNWIAKCMERIEADIQSDIDRMKIASNEDSQDKVLKMTGLLWKEEWALMEHLLSKEIGEWEHKILQHYQDIVGQIARREKDDEMAVELNKQLKRSWRQAAWERLKEEEKAAKARFQERHKKGNNRETRP